MSQANGSERRPLVVANWKLNGSLSANAELVREFAHNWSAQHRAEVVVCPAYPYLAQVAQLLDGSSILLGAQDASQFAQGAYTGEVSAAMLADLGCRYAIVGHSERRNYFAESNQLVAEKFARCLDAGVTPIFCVGESLSHRESGQALAFIGSQLQSIIDRFGVETFASAVVAYEPIWAVGTGRVASAEQIDEVHGFIRAQLSSYGGGTRVLYGGSVKPDNAAQIFALDNVDGALVGGASLKAGDFAAICVAADK